MDYDTLYPAYYAAFADRGVPHAEAHTLADNMARNGGRLSPELRPLAQGVIAAYIAPDATEEEDGLTPDEWDIE